MQAALEEMRETAPVSEPQRAGTCRYNCDGWSQRSVLVRRSQARCSAAEQERAVLALDATLRVAPVALDGLIENRVEGAAH